MALSVLVQAYLAGAAAAVDADFWAAHKTWIAIFQWLSVPLAIAGFLGTRYADPVVEHRSDHRHCHPVLPHSSGTSPRPGWLAGSMPPMPRCYSGSGTAGDRIVASRSQRMLYPLIEIPLEWNVQLEPDIPSFLVRALLAAAPHSRKWQNSGGVKFANCCHQCCHGALQLGYRSWQASYYLLILHWILNNQIAVPKH